MHDAAVEPVFVIPPKLQAQLHQMDKGSVRQARHDGRQRRFGEARLVHEQVPELARAHRRQRLQNARPNVLVLHNGQRLQTRQGAVLAWLSCEAAEGVFFPLLSDPAFLPLMEEFADDSQFMLPAFVEMEMRKRRQRQQQLLQQQQQQQAQA